jgi:hypothetical protein
MIGRIRREDYTMTLPVEVVIMMVDSGWAGLSLSRVKTRRADHVAARVGRWHAVDLTPSARLVK